MADVGDQHNGGLASGKVKSTVREVNYLTVCHGALTDIWSLGEDSVTGISLSLIHI